MDKPNTIESVIPLSGEYSLKRDLRLNLWLLVATCMYLVELTLNTRNPQWSPLWRGLLALAPLISSLLYVRSWIRFVRSLDEFQRRLQLEAFLFAALGTATIGATCNTLAMRDVSLGFMNHGLTLGGTFVSMIFLWFGRTLALRTRYQ
jgi:hypothetical protein